MLLADDDGYNRYGYPGDDREVPVSGYSMEYEGSSNTSSLSGYMSDHQSVQDDPPEGAAGKGNEGMSALLEYGGYGAALLEFTTRSPIPEEDYRNLTEFFPAAMRNLSAFLERNRTISVYWRYDYDFNGEYVLDSELLNISREFTTQMQYLNTSLGIPMWKTREFRDSFNILVATLYGFIGTPGYSVTMRVPIEDGRIFLPVSTAGLWNGTEDVLVVLECDDSLSLEMNRRADLEAFDDGKHYYVHTSLNSSMKHDLEGRVLGDSKAWERRKTGFNEWMHGNRYAITLVMFNLLLFAFSYSVCSRSQIRKDLKGKDRYLLYLTLAIMLGTFMIGYLWALVFCIIGYVGGTFARNNRILLLGPAGKGMKRHSPEDRVLLVVYTMVLLPILFFEVILVIVALDMILQRSATPVGFAFAIAVIQLMAGPLGFLSWRIARVNGPGMTEVQRLVFGKLYPPLDYQFSYADLGFLGVFFGVFPVSVYGFFLVLSAPYTGLGDGYAFLYAFVLSAVVVSYLMIKVMEVDRKEKARRNALLQETRRKHPDIHNHIVLVKWVGAIRYLNLVKQPSSRGKGRTKLEDWLDAWKSVVCLNYDEKQGCLCKGKLYKNAPVFSVEPVRDVEPRGMTVSELMVNSRLMRSMTWQKGW